MKRVLGIFHFPQDLLSMLSLNSGPRADLYRLYHLPPRFHLGLDNWEPCRYQTVDGECGQEFISLPIVFLWSGSVPLLKVMAPARQPSPPSSVSCSRNEPGGRVMLALMLLALGGCTAHCAPLLHCSHLCK